MTATPGLERKVRQLDNDVQAIYEMIGNINGTLVRHGNRLAEIDEKLHEHDARFDGVDGRLGGIDGRLGGIDGRLDGIDGRLDRLEGSVGEVLTILRAR